MRGHFYLYIPYKSMGKILRIGHNKKSKNFALAHGNVAVDTMIWTVCWTS